MSAPPNVVTRKIKAAANFYVIIVIEVSTACVAHLVTIVVLQSKTTMISVLGPSIVVLRFATNAGIKRIDSADAESPAEISTTKIMIQTIYPPGGATGA